MRGWNSGMCSSPSGTSTRFAATVAALAAQPGYVTAYENLGDLYLSMAEQAYGKALGLDAENRVARAKLEMARELADWIKG